MSDNPPTDRPKKTPGPTGDPRRGHPGNAEPETPPDTSDNPTGPPEGYAEQGPGSDTFQEPTNRPIAPPQRTQEKVNPEGAPRGKPPEVER